MNVQCTDENTTRKLKSFNRSQRNQIEATEKILKKNDF